VDHRLTIFAAVYRLGNACEDGADFRSNAAKRLEQFLLGKSPTISRLFAFSQD
jgi:hypothetical protein